MSVVFPTVVFLIFDLQISLIRLPTLWPGMVSRPSREPHPPIRTHTHTRTHCTYTLDYITGPEFEERIRLNEAGNPKFNFLALHDPYHAYYEHKIKEIREGVAQEAAAAPPPLMQQVCHIMKVEISIPYSQKFSPLSPLALIGKIFIIQIYCPVLMST